MNTQARDSRTDIDEGVGKSALVGLAALTAMVLPSSARTVSSNDGARNAPIVRNVGKTYGGYSFKQAKNIIARTIFVESTGEGNRGMNMVATTIWNRSNGTPESMPDVCKAEKQYSCWNGMTASEWDPSKFEEKDKDGIDWVTAQSIAESMLKGTFHPVGAYTHYYANRGKYAVKMPDWAEGAVGKQVGNHIFFTGDEIRRAAAAKRMNKGRRK